MLSTSENHPASKRKELAAYSLPIVDKGVSGRAETRGSWCLAYALGIRQQCLFKLRREPAS